MRTRLEALRSSDIICAICKLWPVWYGSLPTVSECVTLLMYLIKEQFLETLSISHEIITSKAERRRILRLGLALYCTYCVTRH
jgi:hypothetical protein